MSELSDRDLADFVVRWRERFGQPRFCWSQEQRKAVARQAKRLCADGAQLLGHFEAYAERHRGGNPTWKGYCAWVQNERQMKLWDQEQERRRRRAAEVQAERERQSPEQVQARQQRLARIRARLEEDVKGRGGPKREPRGSIMEGYPDVDDSEIPF